MASAGIQLYTLRNVDEPLPRILERVADAGFDGVEFAYRVYDADRDELVRTLEETGLETAGAHVPLDRLEDDLEETLELFRELGCETITVPGVDEEYFTSADRLDDLAGRLDPVGATLADRDIAFGYHNHDFEFEEVEGMTALEALIRRTEHVTPQVDLGLAQIAGTDPVSLIDRLGRVPQVHLKDVDLDRGESVPIGEGDLDLEACVEAFEAADGEWLIYEYEGDDPLASLGDAADAVGDLC